MFTPDGNHILAHEGSGNNLQVWESLPELSEPPPWMEHFVNAVSGRRFNEHGQLTTLRMAERVRAREIVLTALQQNNESKDGAWERMARWVFAPVDQRMGLPNSKVSARELIRRASTPKVSPANPGVANVTLPVGLFRPDEEYWFKSADTFYKSRNYKAALGHARKALLCNPQNSKARRIESQSLQASAQIEEAFEAYRKLHAMPEATVDDFLNAGSMAARMQWREKAATVYADAEQRFPNDYLVFYRKGWSLLRLAAPAEALEAFRRSENLLTEPGAGMFLGLAVSRWQVGQKDAAVADYRRAIAADAKFAAKAKMAALAPEDPSRAVVMEMLEETLRRHPELAPSPPPATPRKQ